LLMGATLPLMIGHIKRNVPNARTSFSFLYMANVVGAVLGTWLTSMALIELLGFHKTLIVGAIVNFAIGLAAIYYSTKKQDYSSLENEGVVIKGSGAEVTPKWYLLSVLFITGFVSMAMEVGWVRAFTPVTLTTIYAFAKILATYLVGTWLGAFMLRRHYKAETVFSDGVLVFLAAATSILPVILSDPYLHPTTNIALASIFPFCFILGYLTPKLVDRFSLGDPKLMGQAYAINILGSILGPLVAGYFLLPWVGTKVTLLILSLPIVCLAFMRLNSVKKKSLRVGLGTACIAFLLIGYFVSHSYEDGIYYGTAVVKRDHTATVVAHGLDMNKKLLVNGVGITSLEPATKFMAHFPLVLIDDAKNTLVICFGMGTTFRSLLTWNINSAAVELIPSVRDVFPYFHSDAAQYLNHPKGRIVIDDGRRFLLRTKEKFDLVTIDPPPPIEAAGSSLLYSSEFYELIKTRLTPNGMLAQWFPGGDTRILNAVTRSLLNSFPYVRLFRSIKDSGYHFLASNVPINVPSAAELLLRMPEAALQDMIEWHPGVSALSLLEKMVANELNPKDFLGDDLTLIVSDDQPANEYFFLHRRFQRITKTYSESW